MQCNDGKARDQISSKTMRLNLNLLLAPLIVLAVHGADPNKPHIHKGSIEPFKPGPPPPLSAKDLATLNSGKPVQQTVEVNGAGRAMATFDVAAPPSLVWDCILDLKNYPRMVPGVSAVELYREALAAPNADRAMLTLGLVAALLDDGRLAEAESALNGWIGLRGSAWQLRAGVAAVTARKIDAAKAALAAVKETELAPSDRAWWFYLQGLLAGESGDVKATNKFF
jgi:hypothetical protein